LSSSASLRTPTTPYLCLVRRVELDYAQASSPANAAGGGYLVDGDLRGDLVRLR